MQQIVSIEDALLQLNTVSLNDLNNVSLLDRQDTKYTFNASVLPKIISSLKDDYKVLSIENKRISQYETLYFDTHAFLLYTQHHNKEGNRYKIRYRRYVDSNQCFLEIKLKNNKRRTIKIRIADDAIHANLEGSGATFINDNTPYIPTELEAKIWVYYKRITLVNNDFTERVTIDIELQFHDIENDIWFKEWTDLAIIEIKQNKATRQSPVVQLLKTYKLPSIGVSKYCAGTFFTNSEVKKNAFKSKILTINRLLNKNYYQHPPKQA